ncbi:MAG TPA: serpin family protein [Bryobacteraceae bacterium]|nr:serpin family protein [Bryobacteraceae bacterium]
MEADVDGSEEGTEAAAASGVVVALVAMVQTPSELAFRAEHLYVFFIRDTRSGLILFTRRFLDLKREPEISEQEFRYRTRRGALQHDAIGFLPNLQARQS